MDVGVAEALHVGEDVRARPAAQPIQHCARSQHPVLRRGARNAGQQRCGCGRAVRLSSWLQTWRARVTSVGTAHSMKHVNFFGGPVVASDLLLGALRARHPHAALRSGAEPAVHFGVAPRVRQRQDDVQRVVRMVRHGALDQLPHREREKLHRQERESLRTWFCRKTLVLCRRKHKLQEVSGSKINRGAILSSVCVIDANVCSLIRECRGFTFRHQNESCNQVTCTKIPRTWYAHACDAHVCKSRL